jgi:aminoglycoside phosphotransferase (APT) family kinase protein
LVAVHALEWVPIRDILVPPGQAPDLASDVRRLLDWYSWAARGRTFPILETALSALAESLPRSDNEPVLVWGDARLGNIIFAPDLTVAAVIDWEIATLGPRELDVGWWLMMDEFAAISADRRLLAGLPSRAETISRYEKASGLELRPLGYYELLAATKLALTLIPAADSLVARGLLDHDSRFAFENVPTQLVATYLEIDVPPACHDYRRLSRMDRIPSTHRL